MNGVSVLLYIYLIYQAGLFNALERFKRFVKDENLKGYKCMDENIIFNMTISEIACALMCEKELACSSMIYFPDTGRCTGCSSFTGVNNLAESNSVFYKRGYRYLGCYDDCPRILIQHDLKTSSQQSTEYCLTRCRNMDASFSLTEYSKQCFCGVSVNYNIAKMIPESECSWTCAGNASQKCGGFCKGSLYRTEMECQLQ